MSRLHVSTVPQDEGHLVSLAGELDAASSPQLAETLGGLEPDDARLVLDMAGVEFIDSAGLNVIVEADSARKDAGGSLSLRNLSARVSKVFEYAGLLGHLDVEDGAA